MTENFSQIKCETPKHRSRKLKEHQAGSMQNQPTKQIPAPRHIIIKLQKIKHKEKVKGGGTKIFQKESYSNFPQKTSKKEESKTFKVSEKHSNL